MLEGLFTLDSLVSLVTLTLLEIVLGIDNVIFVSILLGRLPEDQTKKARRLWVILGIIVRSGLLIGLGWACFYFIRAPRKFTISWKAMRK